MMVAGDETCRSICTPPLIIHSLKEYSWLLLLLRLVIVSECFTAANIVIIVSNCLVRFREQPAFISTFSSLVWLGPQDLHRMADLNNRARPHLFDHVWLGLRLLDELQIE